MVGAVWLGQYCCNACSKKMILMILQPAFFSTSSVGAPGPVINGVRSVLKDAYSLDALAEMDIIITCQGGEYTKSMYQSLIDHGWEGYWIDAASALRMDERACIIHGSCEP